MNDVELAKHLAFKYHAGQTYGEHFYTYHLEMVARSVRAAYNNDERYVIIAWLHDILEDTACTVDMLNALFDKDVVDAVVALTKHDNETRDEYLIRLRLNPLAREVKLHDAFCNMTESFVRYDKKRVRKYADTILKLTN